MSNTGQMTDYQKYIALSRYARWIPELNRRESWEETVSRYFNFFGDRLGDPLRAELEDAYHAVVNLEVMPSMRCLMTAGKALDRDNVSGFNCAYAPCDSPRFFDELCYILMCGTGVGFSVERQYINELPPVAEEMHGTDTVITVADSKRGWAEGFRELVSLLYAGRVPGWDLSRIRPAGSRLKTFGGRASGPEPLGELFEFSVELFRRAAGRKLTSLECHDLACKIAEIVVVGGVRRSALISLSNPSDDRIRRAKHGEWYILNPQRALANNSACYTEKPDFESFLEEWVSLYESKSGERGVFSRVASQKQAAKNGRRDTDHDFGTNPCFTGDMRLLTADGYMRIDQMDGEQVDIINANGDVTEGYVWCTGEKPTVEVRFFKDKDSITCTPDHVFMLNDGSSCEAKDLKGKRPMPYYAIKNCFGSDNGDAFLAGFIQGDGNTTRLLSESHRGLEVNFGENDGDIARMYGQETGEWYSREAKDTAIKYQLEPSVLPERGLTHIFVNNSTIPVGVKSDFFAGLFSANGCVIKSDRVALKTTCRKLADQVSYQLNLFFGIESYITTNKPTEVRFSNGDYVCKESFDVNISRYNSLLKFAEWISFGQEYKRKSLEKTILNRAPCVSSVNDYGVHKVYDFHEPETHWGVVGGTVVHNCSEIILRPHQFCNLSEAVARPGDTLADLKRKVRLATILGTLQSTLTDFRYLRKIWKQNTEEERLLGVSLTGIMDHPVLNDDSDVPRLAEWLTYLREVAVQTNKEWADKLGIPCSTAITCVKPSGTVSQLVDSSSGIHPRHSEYYIRRVRADKKDPLAIMMQDQGVPCEEDVTNPSNLVFSFPQKAPDEAVADVSATDQLSLWEAYQEYWCEHKPSCTVYYSDDEFLEVGQWIYNNFDDVSGLSFLPRQDHKYRQAPYEEITEEEYYELLDAHPDISWEALPEYETEDFTEGSQELACVGPSCEI